jgi:hypothetical protein
METSWRRAPVVGNGFARLTQEGTSLSTISDATNDVGQPRLSIVVFSKNAHKTAKFVGWLEEASAHNERLLHSVRHRELGAQAQPLGGQARIATRPSIALSMLLQLGGDV